MTAPTGPWPDLPWHADPQALDAAWFTALFAARGLSGRVTQVTRQGVGTGQIGTSVRFTFRFADGPGGAPGSLVGKFPSDNEQSRATGKMYGHYRREVTFYRAFPELARRIAPGAWFAAHDPQTDGFVLIMEDMAPAVQGDQIAGCSPQEAQRALGHAAILHAARWRDEEIEAFDWLQGSKVAPPDPVPPDLLAQLWHGFKERYADHLQPQEIAVGNAFADRLEAWAAAPTGPRALSHGDYRLDNMLFGPAGSARALAVVDWQTVGVRAPGLDVAYFIGAGLTREERPRHEADLLRHYHACLVAEGIEDYPLADLYRDYRWYAFYGLSVAFGAAMLVNRTERGDAMFLTMVRRHIDQIAATNALALLP